MATIGITEAKKLAKKAGINFKKDFFVQNRSAVNELPAIAKLKGYRKPKNGSYSTARYFFEYLKKK
jgi:hypothetical protein